MFFLPQYKYRKLISLCSLPVLEYHRSYGQTKGNKNFLKFQFVALPPNPALKTIFIEMCHFHQPTDADHFIFVKKLGILWNH